MSAKTLTDLLNQLALLIPDNDTQEISASDERTVIGDGYDSFLNKKDGGLVIESLAGYATNLTPTDAKHFVPKKYVDDIGGSYVLKSGDTMLGTLDLNFNGLKNPGLISSSTDEISVLSNGDINLSTSGSGSINTDSNLVVSGNVLLVGATALDSSSSGGTLSIGTGNASTINIGSSSSVVNIHGTTLYEHVNNLQVSDKLVTLNKGGGLASGSSVGFEIEEFSSINGYLKTATSRDGWLFKAPAASAQLNLYLGAMTAGRTLTVPDNSGTIALLTDITVTSVFGRTGTVVATSGDYTTAQVTESGNLYFTNARTIAATLTGYTSGAGIITSSDSILSAIQKLNGNTAALVTGVSSVYGRTGAVVATSGDYNTSLVTESGNLYFTNARAIAATLTAYTQSTGTLSSSDSVLTGVQKLDGNSAKNMKVNQAKFFGFNM